MPVHISRIIAVVIAIGFCGVATAADEGKAGHKHLSVIISAGEEETKEKRHNARAFGVDFQYRLSDNWSIGGVVERLEVDDARNTVVVVPFSYHFGGGFRAFAGPGYEFKAVQTKDKALIRVGLGYEFHLNDHWTLAPEAINDFLDGEGNTWLVGIAIGYGFH